MAGSAVPSLIEHRSRGVVRTDATITCDASGVATAAVVGVGFGRLVGFLYDGGLDSPAVITLYDAKTGVSLFAYDCAVRNEFGNTTTGDTTGGTAEDLWTTGAAHNLLEGDAIQFIAIAGNGAGGPSLRTTYYVVTTTGFSGTTFCLSDTAAHALAGTNIVNVGATDASSASWVKVSGSISPVALRPSTNVVDNVGANIAAADTAPNVNRDIVLGGKVKIGVSGGGNAGVGIVSLIVDEEGLGDLALTV
jgi:hypothetical protein